MSRKEDDQMYKTVM